MSNREVIESSKSAGGFMPLEIGRAARVAMPRGEAPENGALLRLRSRMAADGLSCDLARLCVDRLYAYECIAAANASANPGLRRMALELFQIFRRRDLAGTTTN
jgi:hypothetical protein